MANDMEDAEEGTMDEVKLKVAPYESVGEDDESWMSTTMRVGSPENGWRQIISLETDEAPSTLNTSAPEQLYDEKDRKPPIEMGRHWRKMASFKTRSRISSVRKMTSFKTRSLTEECTLSDEEFKRMERAAILIQSRFRAWITQGVQLHRNNLIERLRHEQRTVTGCFRLVNMLLVFFFIMAGLFMASSSAETNGVQKAIAKQFGLELSDVGVKIQKEVQKEEISELLRQMSAASKVFFPQSSAYYASSFSIVDVLTSEVKFNVPRFHDDKETVKTELGIFSFTVWIAGSTPTGNSYLNVVSKHTSASDTAHQRPCWGWYLNSKSVMLRWGAHDFHPSGQSAPTDVDHHVMLPLLYDGSLTLLTIVFNGTHITLFKNMQEMSSATLSAPLTNCHNDRGIMVGDTGLTLSQLRFYPMILTPERVREVYEHGFLISKIGSASDPVNIEPDFNENLMLQFTILSQSVEKSAHEIISQQGVKNIQQTNDELKSSQLADLLDAVHEVPHFPEVPSGELPPPPEKYDAISNRSYYELVGKAVRVSKDPSSASYWTSADFPRWKGSSVTFMTWFKGKNVGPYILAKSSVNQGRGMMGIMEQCWSFWYERDGVFAVRRFLNGLPGGTSRTAPIQDPRTHPSLEFWRHLAIVLDNTTDTWSAYLDGEEVLEMEGGNMVAGRQVGMMDCDAVGEDSDPLVYLGYNPLEDMVKEQMTEDAFFADFRMYVGPALTRDDIHDIAFAPAEADNIMQECTEVNEDGIADHLDQVDDPMWHDEYGHTCMWYATHKGEFPSLCSHAGASQMCKNTCASLQCYAAFRDNPQAVTRAGHFIWDTVQYFSPKEKHGMVCISDRRNKTEVIAQCRRDAAANVYDMPSDGMPHAGTRYAAWDFHRMARESGRGKMVNLTDCDALEAAIDETCTFSHEAMRNATQEVRERGGDYTIFFWVKSRGRAAFDPSGNFLPHVSFLSNLAPVSGLLELVADHDNQHASVYAYSSCPSDTGHEVPLRVDLIQADVGPFGDDWSFVAISVSNTSQPTATMSVAYNQEQTGFPGESEVPGWHQCMYDDSEPLIDAIEINYEMMMSPITILSGSMRSEMMQQLFSKNQAKMNTRIGPAQATSTVLEFEVEKSPYMIKNMAVSTPIIFQERVTTTNTTMCPISFSDSFINDYHVKAVRENCVYPRICDDKLVKDPHTLFSCPGQPQTDGTFFGLEPVKFMGRTGFAEYLYSLTDNQFLPRDGEVLPTSAFVDSGTSQMSVSLVFYAAEYGITTVMQVVGDMVKISGSVQTVELHNYKIITGSQLAEYFFFHIMVIVNIWIHMIDTVIQQLRLKRSRDAIAERVQAAYDLVLSICLQVILVVRLKDMANSEQRTKDTTGKLASINWDLQELSPLEKKHLALGYTNDLLDLVAYEERCNTMWMVLLFLILLRILSYTSFHPRLALLTGTVTRAFDDMWHTALLVVLISVCFGVIGTWRFGGNRTDFIDLEATMQTQFLMLFGGFQENWVESTEMIIYTVSYMLVQFILILNFILAIIVEAYMKVREVIEEMEVEAEFFHDVFNAYLAHFVGMLSGWPDNKTLAESLESYCSRRTVGSHELRNTGMFKRGSSIVTFLRFYKGFDFLEPGETKEDPNEELVSNLEKRIALMLDKKPTTKRERLLGKHSRLFTVSK
mmetsp:Transcript_21274/g.46660  ORF Transcript_21274/g.46660 Transcript_21274/m.46660 type:complete len:1658 (-) Transcript_21274:219-5192(-)